MRPASAADHSTAQRNLLVATAAATKILWAQLGAGSDFDQAWKRLGPRLVATLTAAQLTAALEAQAYVAAIVAELELDAPAAAVVQPRALAGVAADGRALASLLYEPVIRAKQAIGAGAPASDALATGGRLLDLITATTISDTSRTAVQLGIVARPSIPGYVRVLNTPSCSRCVILAGKWYRWNEGFARHPKCDCYHLPASKAESGTFETDPYEHFRALTTAEQDAAFGKANAQAIRDGADIYQVVNAGRRGAGLTTLEGVRSRRGFATYRLNGNVTPDRYSRPNFRRLTPEGIYRIASDRDEALKLLEQFGYITGYGQATGGAIAGPVVLGREGFGQLGRGGTRVAARQAVLAARRAGRRTPGVRATMTAAERRASDAGYGDYRDRLTAAGRQVFDRTYLATKSWRAAVDSTS